MLPSSHQETLLVLLLAAVAEELVPVQEQELVEALAQEQGLVRAQEQVSELV